MNHNHNLTIALLGRHNVSSLEEITRDMISTEDLKIINACMSLEAKEVIADAAGHADEAIDSVVIKRDHPRFEKAGFQNSTEEELMIIGRVYGVHGREIDITTEGIIVHPRTILQKRKSKQFATVG